MTYQSNAANSENDIAELFANFFSDNFVQSSNSASLEHILARATNDAPVVELSLDEVLHGLQKIDVNKGRGPDVIHPIILKNCASSLAAPLHLLFNKSLAEGSFPSKWKTSYVQPFPSLGKGFVSRTIVV